jgi:hypothetical protein
LASQIVGKPEGINQRVCAFLLVLALDAIGPPFAAPQKGGRLEPLLVFLLLS